MKKPAELYACLHVREFPAQALLRLRPELQSRPCVVMEGKSPSQYVCSLNTKARMLQMSQGMTRVEVDSYPQTMVLKRSLKLEAVMKSVLLECAAAFSPRVEDQSTGMVFLCCIDITGTQSLFGSPEMLARNLLQRVRDMGITARITVSANFHAAVCLARGLSASIPVKAIRPGDEAAVLACLPLSVLDLTETQADTFALWGIRSLGMLAALPEEELIARMGQSGKRHRQAACGKLPHFFQPVEIPFRLEEQMELDTPVDLLDSLLFGVNIMLEQLIARAQARVLALASVTITLTLEGSDMYTRTVRPALPANDKALWLKLLQLDLEAHPPGAAILGVTLSAEPGSPVKMQLGLFSPQVPDGGRLDVTLARIRAIVGDENAGRAVLQDTHAQENFRMEPFCVPSGEAVMCGAPHARSSLRQLRPPKSASVHLHDGRPAVFFFCERKYAVERAYGPWVVSGNWWNQTLWGMEQWDLVARGHDESMLCCCMVRDMMQNRWQMAAFYD